MGAAESSLKKNPDWKINPKAWSGHKNMDMCGQGDIMIISDWRAKYSVEDLKKIVEQNGYSGFSVGSFGHAALKSFNYQLTLSHCRPSPGYTNTIYIYSPENKIPSEAEIPLGWNEHTNMDMCGQGDVEFIQNCRKTHTLQDLRKIAEEKGYSAISVGGFDFAAFKKFDYQLTINHCKKSKGYKNSIHIYTPSEKSKMVQKEKKLEEKRENASQGWEELVNMDMCGQGDVEMIKNWRGKHSIDGLKQIAEDKGYSAFSIGAFDFAAFKKFDYQLTADHCKPSRGYSNSIWIYNPVKQNKFEETVSEKNEKYVEIYPPFDVNADVAPPPYSPEY